MESAACFTLKDYRDDVSEPLSNTPFASVHVESCRLRNFRGIVDCSVEFEANLTLLVGRNNAGKSRVLRALSVAMGSPADVDDLTVGDDTQPTIDVVVAPNPDAATAPEEAFSKLVGRRLEQIQVLQEQPLVERFAWRTVIERSGEGLGVRSTSYGLIFDSNAKDWVLPSSPIPLTRDQRSMFAAELVDTRRDLFEELTRRGSAIRRVLSDLEVDDETRRDLEQELSELGGRIVTSSLALEAIRKSLDEMERQVGSLGKPALNPLPIRLEELARSVTIDLDAGAGALPIRLHGAGARSLASLQVQGVHYTRRLGQDGPSIKPHPLTLVEEPEAHLHPQAQLELSNLLQVLPCQVIASTHSSHVVTSIEPRCIRLIRSEPRQTKVIDLGPAQVEAEVTHRASRPSTHVEEMEKLKRLVERPFGELLFSSAVVLGDGATERAFLPVVFRHALGHRAHGVCVVDPASLGGGVAHATIKFAKLAEIPWLIFCDSDGQGRAAAQKLVNDHGDGSSDHVVWITAQDGADKSDSAIERMLAAFDPEICRDACVAVRPDIDRTQEPLRLLKQLKGSGGSLLAQALIEKYPAPATWPAALRKLVNVLSDLLPRDDLG